MDRCIYLNCNKERLNGYKCCEDHIGAYLKEEQEEHKRDAEYQQYYANLYDD